MKIFIFIVTLITSLYSQECNYTSKNLKKDISKYKIRINDAIDRYNLTCNALYAYNVFLNDASNLDQLEDDVDYIKNLGAFAIEYPYIATYISSKEVFKFFNKKYPYVKKDINQAIKYAHLPEDKKAIGYIMFALDITQDKNKLTTTLKTLKSKYKLEDLEVVSPFWDIAKQKYDTNFNNIQSMSNSFHKLVKKYKVLTLQKYLSYQNDFFPVLLPADYTNLEYANVLKRLLSKVSSHKPNEQLYFIKNVSNDIELVLDEGYKSDDIVKYLSSFITKKDILQHASIDSCEEKEAVAILVSRDLNLKLDWKHYDNGSFNKIIRAISKEEDIKKKINLLGLYNYASYIYARFDDNSQKDMFKDVINLTDNMTFNLSLVYALGEHTGYFDEIVNNTSMMSDREKYRKIFYVSRDGHKVLNLLKNENKVLFVSEIKSLINTPYENLYDMTTSEKINIAIDVVDYASYATLLIPGAGIAVQIGKTLAKTTAKRLIKQKLKTIVKNGSKYLKQQGKNKVKNTAKIGLNKKIDQDVGIDVCMQIYDHLYSSPEQKSLCTGE